MPESRQTAYRAPEIVGGVYELTAFTLRCMLRAQVRSEQPHSCADIIFRTVASLSLNFNSEYERIVELSPDTTSRRPYVREDVETDAEVGSKSSRRAAQAL
jgi:hypothetical protein